MLGVVPFGLIYGVLALSEGIPASLAQAMSLVVFAGSAQFILVQLIAANTPVLMLVATACIVNARHVLYSVSIAPHVQHLHPRFKWILAYLLTDEAYAVAMVNYQKTSDATHKHWFFLGTGIALWATWQASTAAGLLIGAQLPTHWPLDFAIPLTFIALAVPMIQGQSSIIAALTASATVILVAGIPYKLDLIVATFVGILAGIFTEYGISPQNHDGKGAGRKR